VQDEITQAIVAAIEPQLYAAEGFRARRKAPDNMRHGTLVMRALSPLLARHAAGQHSCSGLFWRKQIGIDPNYGQALGVLGG